MTALAGAVAGDAWRQVHEAIARLWRRGHSPQQADTIGAELDELREQLLQARRDGDTGTEHALEGAWQHRPLARRCNPVGCPAAAPGSAAAPCTTGTTGSSPVRASGSKRCGDRRSCGTGAAGPVTCLAGGVSRALVSASVDAGDWESDGAYVKLGRSGRASASG